MKLLPYAKGYFAADSERLVETRSLIEQAGRESCYLISVAELIDTVVHALTQLSYELEAGDALGPYYNEEISFDYNNLDSLGNPLQIKHQRPRICYASSQIADLLMDVAQGLIKFKSNGDSEAFFKATGDPFAMIMIDFYQDSIRNLQSELQDIKTEFGNTKLREIYWYVQTRRMDKNFQKRENDLSNDLRKAKALNKSLKKKVKDLRKLCYGQKKSSLKK